MSISITQNGVASRDSRNEFLAILDQISDAVVITDAGFRIRSWNQAAEGIYGWQAEEVLGRKAIEVFGREFAGLACEKAGIDPNPEHGREIEVVHNHREGRKILVQVRAWQRRDDQGEITGIISILRKVPEPRPAEEGVQERDWLLRTFLEQLPVGVALVNAQGEIAVSNAAFRQVIPGKVPSKDSEELQRWRSWSPDGKLVQPDNWPSARALRGERVAAGMDFLFTDAGGRETWQRVTSVPFRDTSGALGGAISVVQDVDVQKRAEAGLRENEERLRQAADLVGLCPYTWDPTTGARQWGEGIRKMWGLPPGTPIDHEVWWAGIHPDDRAMLQEQVARCLDPNGDGTYEAEYRVNAMDGVQRWVSVRGRTVFCDGKAVHHAGVAVDITERKKTEARLRADVAALTRMHELSRKILGEKGLGPLLQEVMDAAVMIVGAERGTLQLLEGNSLRIVAHHGHELPFLSFFESAETRASACGEAVKRVERVVIPDIEKSPIFAGTHSLEVLRAARVRAIQSTPLMSRTGKLLGMLTTQWTQPYKPDEHDLWRIDLLVRQAADLIEEAHAEASLLKNEELVRQAVSIAGLGIFEHDHRSDKIEYSKKTREMMGFGPEEEITVPGILQHVVPEDREAVGAAIRRAHAPAGDGRFEVEYRVPSPGGQKRWMSARSQTFFEGEGSERQPVRTIGAVLDVTERKEFQSKLEGLVAERTAKLQELVGDLEHFSYSITHDLKAPLRAMRGFAEIGTMLCGARARKGVKDALARIASSAERMECLITDALSYSRAVRQELPLTDVDTGALLRGMVDSYPELQPSKAHIQLENPLPVVLGNEAGLTQCFSNLLGNAVKFVHEGDKPEVRVWAEEREGWARIWVADNGIGIPQEMLPRVFDMFSRGSSRYEGTGIGLALVRKATQRMGGRLGVESQEGKGSRFWIELKLGEMATTAPSAAIPPAKPDVGTVLYVEDEESDALFMKMAFARKGLGTSVQVVRDGRAAIDYLSGAGEYADRHEYPLPVAVLLDLNLPCIPGFEVLKWMRNHPDFARIPIVVFTSSAREDDRVKALELGANEFVAKPCSSLKFGEVLELLQEKWLGMVVPPV